MQMPGAGSHKIRTAIEDKNYGRELGQEAGGAYQRKAEELYALADRDGGHASLIEYMDLPH